MKPFPTIALIATLLISSHRAAADDFLDQIPDNAALIGKVHNLDKANAKLKKLMIAMGAGNTFQNDPMDLYFQSAHLTKGVDRTGDVVYVGCGKTLSFTSTDQQTIMLVPVTDYPAFLGNFTAPATGGDGITSVADKDSNQKSFIAHWGGYAALSVNEDLLAKKPAGVKLHGPAADEFAKRDLALYIRMDQLRDSALAKLKGDDNEVAQEMMEGLPDVPAAYKPVEDVFQQMLVHQMRQFVEDANAAAVGFDITDDGVLFSAVADFKPGSTLATFAASLTAANPPALTGLPNEPYMLVGSAAFSPEMKKQIIATLIDPMSKNLDPKDPASKATSELLTALRGIVTSTDSVAGGLVGNSADKKKAPYQLVRVATGDSAAIKKSYTDGWSAITNLVQRPGPMSQPGEMRMVFKPDSATVAHFDLFSLHLGDYDPAYRYDDVDSLVGPKAFGGWIGSANPRSMLIVTGVNSADPFFLDSLAAAKAGKDVLSASKPISATAAHLPPNRPWEMFVNLQRFAEMSGGPAAAADEQPIGWSFTGAGASLRVDAFLPVRDITFVLPIAIQSPAASTEPARGQ